MDLIKVNAHIDLDGNIIPLKFTWEGHHYTPDSIGRRWHDEKGAHILVMIPGGRVFELLYVSEEGYWYLARSGAGRMFV
jgi:hypothetical protein